MVAMGSFKFPTISRSVFQPFKFFEKNFTSPSSSNESPPPHPPPPTEKSVCMKMKYTYHNQITRINLSRNMYT